MLDSQEYIRNTLYFRLDSSDARGVDGLRVEYDLKIGHTFTGEENCWVQVGLYYQIKPKWVCGSLKCEIDCQRILTLADI